MQVYFDNAATTPLDKDVLNAMLPVMENDFGNPSSIHSMGRKTRSYIETARKTVSRLLNVSPGEIFFTSGGTEADNTAIFESIQTYNIKQLITSPIEHHAVEHTVKHAEKLYGTKTNWVNVDAKGNVDLQHLELLLSQSNEKKLVSLMHANNEIGTLLPLQQVSDLCKKYNALFHSDTVQTMGHYALDLKATPVDFITCAAHKFHGPKGVGFLYINQSSKIGPMIHGGAQERNMRGGTENLYGIIGLAKALEICYNKMQEHQKHIFEVKQYMQQKLIETLPGTEFNGETSFEKSLYTVLNCCLPEHDNAEMLLFNLDINNIAASGGSACSSGSNQGSHVLKALGINLNRPSIRFSFSKYNTKHEVDFVIKKLAELYNTKQ
ncbi:MAG: cysteine desulfurase [Bacteroidetes bacterium]|nr:cysteine desulfurase [Bacteroidota bacterium]